MNEHPIIMSTEMVRAILDGSKTQTRRVIKPQPDASDFCQIQQGFFVPIEKMRGYCPYGQVGDRLWVRETHFRYGRYAKNGFTKTGKQAWKFIGTTDQVRYADSPPEKIWKGWTREQLNERGHSDWHKRPSIFMPRWASRIDLEITEIRVERVQEISEEDAKAEGFVSLYPKFDVQEIDFTPNSFLLTWDSINAKRGYGWDKNPWVWVIEFRRIL